MGYLKGRMCSLRGLRQQITDERDHDLALVWVQTCVIIHTLVSRIEGDDEDPEWRRECIRMGREGDENDRDEPVLSEQMRVRAGMAWREALKAKLFESGVTERMDDDGSDWE